MRASQTPSPIRERKRSADRSPPRQGEHKRGGSSHSGSSRQRGSSASRERQQRPQTSRGRSVSVERKTVVEHAVQKQHRVGPRDIDSFRTFLLRHADQVLRRHFDRPRNMTRNAIITNPDRVSALLAERVRYAGARALYVISMNIEFPFDHFVLLRKTDENSSVIAQNQLRKAIEAWMLRRNMDVLSGKKRFKTEFFADAMHPEVQFDLLPHIKPIERHRGLGIQHVHGPRTAESTAENRRIKLERRREGESRQRQALALLRQQRRQRGEESKEEKEEKDRDEEEEEEEKRSTRKKKRSSARSTASKKSVRGSSSGKKKTTRRKRKSGSATSNRKSSTASKASSKRKKTTSDTKPSSRKKSGRSSSPRTPPASPGEWVHRRSISHPRSPRALPGSSTRTRSSGSRSPSR